MKLFFRSVLVLLVVAVAGLLAMLFMMFDETPEVAGAPALSSSELSNARVFIENRDPRNLDAGEISAFTIDQKDLELLLNYGLDRLEGGRARVALREGRAELNLSAVTGDNALSGMVGDYLNVHLVLSQWADAIVIEQLRVGSLNVPGWLADTVVQAVHRELHRVPEYAGAMEALNGYSISDQRINVVYQWQPDLVQQISSRGRDMLVPEADRERLMAHARNLSELTNDPALPRVASLAEVLGPMFQFARLRQGDPVEENRAAIQTLAMYIMGVNTPKFLGLPADSIQPMGVHRFTLSDRHDFAQHFLVSAGLTVSAGTGIADSIGLLKEMDDSRGDSGFSFTDIGADRTGVRLAELAVANPRSAAAVQELLTFDLSEDVFMAEFRDLPESLPQAQFVSLYGGVDSPAYNRVIEDIETRISAVRIFRELDGG